MALDPSRRSKFVWTRTRQGARAALRCAIALGCVTAARPAAAQIYSYHDADGRLVLSNVPQANSAETPKLLVKSYAVPTASTIRTTRYATEDRSRTYDDLIVEH